MAECTIYDKLRYIAETKDLIKAAIQAQDVEVLESATFRQYAEYITEIRKVSSVNGMQGDVTITAEDLGALTAIPSEYITETELNEKGYLTAVPDVYITEDELSSQLADKVSQNGLNEAIEGVRNDIPTNVSQLTNDSGYITLDEVPKQDLSDYALKTDIPDISVKQDKLTAGNGISITDNVISLDYEFDLFEVVQSLPTENISDNKVYLLLDSNGSEGNTYIEYLYVDGNWEELGKFKVNIDLSGYATEQWVNEQGFLKEHQDISNLATKEELNTKQDVITDLDSIRSGASKGATALQEVPSTYALKTDILSAKTDTRYTTYDVQNPVLSGNTIVLQNEVTDSRKYHTLGFNSTTKVNVLVTKYINITRYGSEPSIDTNVEDGIEFDVHSGVGGEVYATMGGDVPFNLDKITEVTNILHYEVTYVERDSDNNIIGGFNPTVADVTYDPVTKLLSTLEDGGLSFAQITRTDTNKYLFGAGTDGNEYLENGRYYYNFGEHPLQEGASLIWHPYYNSNLYWDYSVTINGLFNEESDVTTNDKPHLLNDYIRYSNNVKAYILTDKNTTFKTINGEEITGEGNIEIEASANNVPTVQTTVQGTTDNFVYSSGKDDTYGIISDFYTSVSYSSDKASINTKQCYWGSQSFNANDIWSINGATTSKAGLMSSSDKSKLDGIDLTTKQDVITDLDSIRNGAAKGATALQSVPDTYALKTDIPDITTKQDVITDLETIRSGAAKGATALQSVPDTYALKTDIPDITTKQDKLVSGTNIKTINGVTLLGEGNITIEGGEGGADLSDYYTKTETNALVNPKLEQVTLTQAAYDALETKEDNVLYVISDAEDFKFKTINGEQITGEGNIEVAANVDLSDYATKSELNAKQDAITDLETIRSGAAKGATALQSVPSTYALKSDIPDITTKQDTLVSGTNIKTINGISLLGEGNISISGEGGGDLSGYYTKAEIDEMIGGASATISDINDLVV